MLMEAILVALWAALCGIDKYDVALNIHRPLITGTVVGLIMGDLQTGLMAGAAMELAWLGLVPNAGAQPPDVTIGAIIGTAFVILTGENPEVGIGIAMPFAVAMQSLIVLLFTAFAPVMHKCDEYARSCNTRGIDNMLYLGLGVRAFIYALVAFLPIYFGSETAGAIVALLPEEVLAGLSAAGRMMPAIGFAMLLKIMLKKEVAAYFFIGFVLVTYLKLPVLAVAILGTCVAVLDYMMRVERQQTVAQAQPASAHGDFSDGI
ncbi:MULTISPECIES: PTS N-acetylgalactosamine transporter subunit IIC [Endozoicomonas]|uniref:PTS N-acetylgalactosamine transporter subunit IIC n=1 Tax=Endozoicomonas TaxID=305899 RepID=UPI000826314B|nr:PTS N-acetylgalactosamine transporter subunit IIC [Endozoicomonas atrinae]